jgi:hypothetical protein
MQASAACCGADAAAWHAASAPATLVSPDDNEGWTATPDAAISALQIAGFAKPPALIAELLKKALQNQTLRWGMV